MANSTKIAIVGLMILLVVVVAQYVKNDTPLQEGDDTGKNGDEVAAKSEGATSTAKKEKKGAQLASSANTRNGNRGARTMRSGMRNGGAARTGGTPNVPARTYNGNRVTRYPGGRNVTGSSGTGQAPIGGNARSRGSSGTGQVPIGGASSTVGPLVRTETTENGSRTLTIGNVGNVRNGGGNVGNGGGNVGNGSGGEIMLTPAFPGRAQPLTERAPPLSKRAQPLSKRAQQEREDDFARRARIGSQDRRIVGGSGDTGNSGGATGNTGNTGNTGTNNLPRAKTFDPKTNGAGASNGAGPNDRRAPPGGSGSAATAGFPKKHELKSGDNLWNLSRKYYGAGIYHGVISAANKGIKINAGNTITIPAPPAAALKRSASPNTVIAKGPTGKKSSGRLFSGNVPNRPKARGGGSGSSSKNYRTYKVKSGDTLSGLAKRFYGNARLAKVIENANDDLQYMQLQAGSTIKIPIR